VTAESTPASSFVLMGSDGRPYALSEQRGHPVLAVFFKSTCSTCAMTFPYVERLYQAYGKRGLAVWGISQDTLDDTLAFAVERGATFPMLLDTTWEASQAYQVEGVPLLVLVGSDGTVAYRGASFSKEDLNEIARLTAAQTHSPVVEIAAANDGKPAFRPG
jgi:peroxiredoxin